MEQEKEDEEFLQKLLFETKELMEDEIGDLWVYLHNLKKRLERHLKGREE